jgi:predicted HTH transcriptional regulator
LQLSIEQRAAASQAGLQVELCTEEGIALLAKEEDTTEEKKPSATPLGRLSPQERVLHQLRIANTPMRTRSLRERCQIKAETLTRTLNELEARNVVMRSKDGWILSKHVTHSDSLPS